MTIIRPTAATDAHLLPDVERSAGALFQSIPDLAWIADDEVTSLDDHRSGIAKGTHWVAVDTAGAIEGFLCAEAVPRAIHIREVAVAEPSQGRGIGRQLVDAAIAHARTHGIAAITLTTFTNVPWNAPYYGRLGFEMVETAQLDVRLAALLAGEAARGLPAAQRCAMRLSLLALPRRAV